MNVFVMIMLVFAALGLVDKILGGKLGFAPEFDRGLSTMGGLALSTVGLYSIGVSFVTGNAEAIAQLGARLPFDPSLLIGSLLAPDMGALGIAQRVAKTPALACFTGAMVSGGLGMTVGYQLPVFLAAVQKEEIPGLMQGFIFGLIPLPVGLFLAGLFIGIPVPVLLCNLLPVILLCAVLIGAFLLAPAGTMKVLIVFGNFIRIVSFVFFGIAVIGVFVPEYSPVDQALVSEMLYMVLRMVIVCCGGLVLSKIALEKLKGPIARAGVLLNINSVAVVGLILSLTQSLAMLPLYSRMDRKGQVMNAAFSVSGAYVFGGQLAFVSSLIPPAWTGAYMANKLIAGALGLLIAYLVLRKGGEESAA